MTPAAPSAVSRRTSLELARFGRRAPGERAIRYSPSAISLLAAGGVDADRAASLAALLIGASEGGVLLARAERDLAVFDAVAAEAVAAVEAAAGSTFQP
jgi:Transcriptional regulator LmrA/YxaF-like, C-terminal domain